MEGKTPTFETVRDRLMPTIEPYPLTITEEMIPGHLYIGVCWKGQRGTHQVTQDTLDAWGTSFPTVLEIARWNLRRKTPVKGWTQIPTVGGLQTYIARDGLSSSRILCVEDLVRPWPFEGVLVAVPTRDQFLVLPMDSLAVLQSMRVMVLAGDAASETGTYPLSNQLFWYDGERWEVVSINHAHNQLEIHPSERFMSALERITSVHLVPIAAEA